MNKKRASGGAFQLDAKQHAALTNCVFHSCIMLAAKAHLCLCACMYISISISLLAPRCVYARVEWARPFSARCLRTCNPLIFAKYVTSLSASLLHTRRAGEGAAEKIITRGCRARAEYYNFNFASSGVWGCATTAVLWRAQGARVWSVQRENLFAVVCYLYTCCSFCEVAFCTI
jgi:hypothetical protein